MIKRGLALTSPLLLLTFAVSAYAWMMASPDALYPVHWGIDGQPDRFAGRNQAFLMMPAIMLGMTLLFCILPGIDPRGGNLKRSPAIYLVAWVGTIAFMTAVHVVTSASSSGLMPGADDALVPVVVPVGIGILLILIGNFLGKARPNWFVGVRTPWTLSSDLSWDKTHRLTGRLMVLGGLVILGGAFLLQAEATVYLVIAGSVVPALVGVVYSYFVWKSDPARETASPNEE